MSKREVVNRMVNLLTQIESLNDTLKEVKDQAKEEGLNAAILVAVAKAMVTGKVDDLKNKSEETIEIIETMIN